MSRPTEESIIEFFSIQNLEESLIQGLKRLTFDKRTDYEKILISCWPKIEKNLVELYQDNYSQTDIYNLIEFFKSETGKKMKATEQKFNDKVFKMMTQIFNDELEK